MNHSLITVGKMAINLSAGVVLSFSDFESVLRVASITITTVLSVIVFVRDSKRRKNEKKNN